MIPRRSKFHRITIGTHANGKHRKSSIIEWFAQNFTRSMPDERNNRGLSIDRGVLSVKNL